MTEIKELKLDEVFENVKPCSLRLHSLELACLSTHPQPTFPTGIIDTANLRRLEVQCWNGPWYSLSLPALTNLKLRDISNRPPLSKLLEMLRGLPALTSLYLEDLLLLAVGVVRPVNLPNIRCLDLCSNTSPKEIKNFLRLIIVPPTATVRITVNGRLIPAHETQLILDDLASSLSSFFSHLCQAADFSYRKLRIIFWDLASLEFYAWRDAGQRISSIPDFTLILRVSRSPPNPDLLRNILPSLPLVNVTTLTLAMIPFLSSENACLCQMQAIKVVGTPEFVEALAQKPKNYIAVASVSFPALQSLQIDCYLFCGEGRHTFNELYDSLAERSRRGAKLGKLTFTDCSGFSRRCGKTTWSCQ